MAFNKYDAARIYKKLRALEPNVSGALGTPPSGSAVGAVGDVVLVTGAGTTTDVLDARITDTTFMELAPADLYGSAEKGAGNIFWSSPADGIMRITHTASTKTRTFKYLLMFALALLLASASSAQVIQDDGVPLEVRPALNFTSDIDCALVGDATDCQVAGSVGTGDIMLESEYMTGATYGYGPPYVDYCEAAQSAQWIDTNLDAIPEVWSEPGVPDTVTFDLDSDGFLDFVIDKTGGTTRLSATNATMGFDADNNGLDEFTFTGSTQLAMFGGSPQAIIVSSSGFLMQANDSTTRWGNGIGVGNGANNAANSANQGNSSCLGREASTDRLFADKNCNFGTVDTPETGEYRIDTSSGGAAPPATCQPGDLWTDTDETVDTVIATTHDNVLLICIAANTWALANVDLLALAGDVDGAYDANDLDEAAVEVELEGVLDLPDLQGVLTVAKGGTGATTVMQAFAVTGGDTCFSGTDYFGLGSNGVNCNATEANVDLVHVGPTMTVGNLKCVKMGVNDPSCDGVVTIRKNSAASGASTCSFADTTSCAASTTTASIASGDTWALQVVDTTCDATHISCTFTGTW